MEITEEKESHGELLQLTAGLSPIEEVAKSAMQGMLSYGTYSVNNIEKLAQKSFEIADAFFAESNKRIADVDFEA